MAGRRPMVRNSNPVYLCMWIIIFTFCKMLEPLGWNKDLATIKIAFIRADFDFTLSITWVAGPSPSFTSFHSELSQVPVLTQKTYSADLHDLSLCIRATQSNCQWLSVLTCEELIISTPPVYSKLTENIALTPFSQKFKVLELALITVLFKY